VVLVLGNTIRLAIESRRDEIVITKLVGGSNAFVRRPLLYTGLWFGLGGGIVAALLVAGRTLLCAPPCPRWPQLREQTSALRARCGRQPAAGSARGCFLGSPVPGWPWPGI
jgi:cell division transport system permease protein